MIPVTARRAQLVDTIQAAIDASGLADAALIPVSADGRAVTTAARLDAGAVIVYPLPGVEWPAPRTERWSWTIAVLCDQPPLPAADRIAELVAVLRDAGVIRYTDRATPTDFSLGTGPEARKITGYTITHNEENH